MMAFGMKRELLLPSSSSHPGGVTWWAYCFYGVVVIAAIFMIDRYQRKRRNCQRTGKSKRKRTGTGK